MTTTYNTNPKLDLVLEKTTDLSPEKVWKAITTPELLKQWFAPRPWKVTDSKVDLRPGGIFGTTMKGPEGEEFTGTGCFLEVIPNRKLIWTDTLTPDFRPAENPFFTAVIILEPQGTGTKYTAIAVHGTEENKKKHEEMGFHDGWGICFDQMVELMKGL